MIDIHTMLADMVTRGASDLHLKVGNHPYFRIDSVLTPTEYDVITDEDTTRIANQLMSEMHRERFERTNEVDFAYEYSGVGRFRTNVFRQRGSTGIVMRMVKMEIPGFEELGLPPQLEQIALSERGIILVTGTTSCGKSTTLAAMIDWINQKRRKHILTVEDPIEYIYRDKKSIISQREVGGDTETFASALRHAFRQDPDVILIGEVRDLETMSIALTAADTGHLVLTTLHTMNVVETITRVISFFPPHQHQQIRLLLAGTLKAIVCQRLLTRGDMPGRVPAIEVMINSAAIRECIMDPDKTVNIPELMEAGTIQYGMQTFDQSIMKLYKQGMITFEEAMAYASNPDDFDLRVKGITGTSDRWEDDGSEGEDKPQENPSDFSKY